MNKVLSLLLVGAIATLAGCASSRQSALQLPGESTRSGLQVPPDLDDLQTAAAPQIR